MKSHNLLRNLKQQTAVNLVGGKLRNPVLAENKLFVQTSCYKA